MLACDPEIFVNRETELAFVNEKISRLARGDPFAPHERVIHFVGPSGIGKSCLLEKCYETFATYPNCVPILIKLEQFENRNDEIVGDFLAIVYEEICRRQNIKSKKKEDTLSKYSTEIIREINKNTKDHTVVLFLDEINIPHKEQLQSIEEYLLAKLLQGNSRFLLITAGRISADWIDFSLRASQKNINMLSIFDEKTTGAQLERLRLGLAPIAGKVIELGGGVPRNNAKLAEHAVGNPPNILNELQALQSLLMSVKSEIEERLHPVIEAMCVLKSFFPEDTVPLVKSHPALGEQWDEISIKEIFLALKQVHIGPGGLINWAREHKSWVMDEPTRALFERELQMRAPELWSKLHYTAYQMYGGWGAEYNSQAYKDKAVYHQECLQSAGYEYDTLKEEG